MNHARRRSSLVRLAHQQTVASARQLFQQAARAGIDAHNECKAMSSLAILANRKLVSSKIEQSHDNSNAMQDKGHRRSRVQLFLEDRVSNNRTNARFAKRRCSIGSPALNSDWEEASTSCEDGRDCHAVSSGLLFRTTVDQAHCMSGTTMEVEISKPARYSASIFDVNWIPMFRAGFFDLFCIEPSE
mmetsp:Transcript_114450/g.227769  ORF Transcript_114450/g.227769 Transcript_114450/m.227769 type:complete len:187 (+) Transcript_114450:70-630(+)|eukprot:CAMPEP_0172820074 /NCGR_PEP_ID=MMETSP1075-20121228/15022_1 /TAXON_ID=2916 /ORGANISM="Ceratium fusus, Strain PA161109" /LENGTH=186 /DNA_ID=CAMNT_0013660695 /DNA_START=48 /DNA_END=608 /DNA_ORIENTATION=-